MMKRYVRNRGVARRPRHCGIRLEVPDGSARIKREDKNMRTKLQIIAFAVGIVFSFQSQAQTGDAIFPKGELSTVKNHTGNIWLKELNVGDSTFDPSIAVATYDAGAKLDWHIHPGGQVLLITEGTGYYQERGKPIQIIHKGDVIKCLPGVEHWHGASPNSGFAYLAVTPTQKGKTIWLEPVSDKDYNSVK
jgi:quercetin dioxygenase-like cupin family protein